VQESAVTFYCFAKEKIRDDDFTKKRAAAMGNIIIKLQGEGDAKAKHAGHDEELAQPLPDF
jgi:hypothetical protein